MKSLSRWLDYIESTHPSHIELGLERVTNVGERLGLLTFNAPVISVAGTNGKGSAVAALEAILSQQGKRVAVYTSPHLLRFTERLRIAGQEQSEAQWVEAFQAIDDSRDDIKLTYFEFTTLAALYQIAAASPDVIVLEVGLGGRLDAVNIVENDCSLITSIDYDHEDWLGSELTQIAREKSGITRPGKPVVVGGSTVANLTEPYVAHCNQVLNTDRINDFFPEWDLPLEKRYSHQIFPTSLRCAALACHCLGFEVSELPQALTKIVLPGRWQSVEGYPNVWLDVAHNPQAIANLSEKMNQQPQVKRWIAVCGLLNDKRAEVALKSLSGRVDFWHLLPTSGPRGQTAESLASKLSFIDDTNSATYVDEYAAFKAAWQNKPADSGIIVFGSFLVVANMVEYLQR